MLTYNVIRATTACAAHLHGVLPRQISFVSACQYMLAAWDILATQSLSAAEQTSYCKSRLKQIAKCIVANRTGRFEPRVLKKRQKNYNLMMQPREVLRARLALGGNSFETK